MHAYVLLQFLVRCGAGKPSSGWLGRALGFPPSTFGNCTIRLPIDQARINLVRQGPDCGAGARQYIEMRLWIIVLSGSAKGNRLCPNNHVCLLIVLAALLR